MNMRRIKYHFDRLSSYSIELDDFSDQLSDVAFDIVTADSGVAGIADQAISGTTPSREQLVVLNQRLLEGDTWVSMGGERYCLRGESTLLEYAGLVKSLQESCRAWALHRGIWSDSNEFS